MTKGKAITNKVVKWRMWIQAGFLAVWLDPFLLRMHNICGPVFHCYSCPLATFACPIGVLANFSALHVFPFFAVGMLLLIGGLVGNFICGWACPFGFLQDLAAKVPVPKFTLPAWTSYFRYVVLLGLVIVIPFLYGEEHPLFFCRLCPAGALEGGMVNTIKTGVWPGAVKLTILGVFLAAIFVKWRPWCTVFCPLGAIYGLFNRISIFFLRVDLHKCKGCNLCEKICKSGVNLSKRTDDPRCVRCLECRSCDAIGVGTIFDKKEGTTEKTDH